MIRKAAVLGALLVAACGGAEEESIGEGAVSIESAALLAASCSGCHAAGGSVIVGLEGRSADDLKTRLTEYKTDEVGGTVMHRLAPGYSEEDIEAVAEFLSKQGEGGQ